MITLGTAEKHGVVNAVIELDNHPNPYLAVEQSLKEIRKFILERTNMKFKRIIV